MFYYNYFFFTQFYTLNYWAYKIITLVHQIILNFVNR